MTGSLWIFNQVSTQLGLEKKLIMGNRVDKIEKMENTFIKSFIWCSRNMKIGLQSQVFYSNLIQTKHQAPSIPHDKAMPVYISSFLISNNLIKPYCMSQGDKPCPNRNM